MRSFRLLSFGMNWTQWIWCSRTLILLHRCLDSIHLGLICQAVYHYLVTNWGFQPALVTSTWELDIQLTFIGLSSFVCQIFFLNRCASLPPKPSRLLDSDDRAGFGFSAAGITSWLVWSLPSASQRLALISWSPSELPPTHWLRSLEKWNGNL